MKGSVPAPDELSICERCGRAAPLRQVAFRQLLGTGIAWVLRRQGGEYCRRCTTASFWRSSVFTLLFGWWGIVSLFMTPVVAVLNVIELGRSMGRGAYGNSHAVAGAGVERTAVPVPEASEVDLDFDALPPIEEGPPTRAEWWLAMGHLRSKKSQDFISLTTALSIIGVVAGVAVLNWVLAVMTGFEVDLRDKILGANAHVVVLRYGGNITDGEDLADRIATIEGVTAAAPFVYTEMMVRSAWGTSGVILKGMDIERTGEVTSIRDDLVAGLAGELETDEQRWATFASMALPIPPPDPEVEGARSLPGVLIGQELQEILQVEPGDTLQVINPLGDGTGLMGVPTPTVRLFRVAGVFFSGMYEYDTKWTYVLNDEAQDFLNIGDTVTGIEVRVDDIDDVHHIAADIDAQLGYPFYSRHWKNLNQALFEALEMEKWVMGLILSTIVGVAGLAIVTTLVMLVITKGREISILKAMGASNGSIMRIFVIEGALIGLVGSLIGTVFGLLGCEFLERYEYPLETDVYYLSSLPVVVEPATVVGVAVVAFAICFVATLYPAWQAASLDPVEGLRYE